MKKLSLPLLLSAFAAASVIAQVPNAGFETWNNLGMYEDPQGWTTLNSTTSGYGFTTASKDATAPYAGSYDLKLETKSFLTYGVPGVITTGKITINISTYTYTIDGGIPLTGIQTPDSLVGYYKYAPAGASDMFSVAVMLTKWNGTSRDTIGSGLFTSSAAQSTYSMFSVVIAYNPLFTGTAADTVNVTIFCDQPATATAGTVLNVDDLSLMGLPTGTISLNELLSKNKKVAEVFPNPAVDKLFIASVYNNNKLLIYNILGNKIDELPMTGNAVNLSSYPEGIYVYEIRTSANTLLHTGRFIVNK